MQTLVPQMIVVDFEIIQKFLEVMQDKNHPEDKGMKCNYTFKKLKLYKFDLKGFNEDLYNLKRLFPNVKMWLKESKKACNHLFLIALAAIIAHFSPSIAAEIMPPA